MACANWLMQFVKGFPTTGLLQQSGVFPTEEGIPPELLGPELLFTTKTARFQERLKKNSRHPQQLWDEAMTQVDKGWFSPPEPLDSSGNFIANPQEACNIAFRFGVLQSDKLRGCDDFKDSLTNKTCHIATPITLPGWDHIVTATKIISKTARQWAFGKIDHRDAYKSLPLLPSGARYAVIALYNPQTQVWNGFRPRTQLFGSIAAVLHYNCLSRIIASLACQILLIPTIGYFDDFGFLTAFSDSDATMRAFAEFFSPLGLELKTEKSIIGVIDGFLGLEAYFPCPPNRLTLSLSLSNDKATRWADLIDRILEEGAISHTSLESLIGRLSFAQTAVFGRFARAMLKPLYVKLYTARYFNALPPALIRNLVWWGAALRKIQQRAIHFHRSKPDWVLYTDAAFDEGPAGPRLASIFFRIAPLATHLHAELLLVGRPGQEELELPHSTSTISGLELAAVVLSILYFRTSLRNTAVTVYVDNNAALAAIINGDSSPTAAFVLIATLWFVAAANNIALRFERVESSRNIADLPTRGKQLPFPVQDAATLPPIEEALRFYAGNISTIAPTLEELPQMN